MKNPEDVEKFLREQMRSLIPVTLTFAQWGVTVLIAFQAALYFIRKETRESLKLAPTEMMPLHRYLIGTAILLFVAIFFHALSNWVGRRYRHYMREFQSLPTKYPDYYKNKEDLFPHYPLDSPRLMIRLLFYFVPLVDVLIYAYNWLWSVAETNRQVFLIALVTSAVTCLVTVPLGVVLVQWLRESSKVKANDR